MAIVQSGIAQTSARTSRRLVKSFFARGCEAWQISKKTLVFLCVLPILVALAGVLSGLISKDAFVWFTAEDGFAENLQVLFYVIALILSLVVARHLFKSGQGGLGALYVAFLIGLFFLTGEEISWGQRIFDWQTPESYKPINKQEETNLHNLNAVAQAFKWVQLAAGAYGTILPLLVLGAKLSRRARENLSWLVPHFTLIPYFVMLFVWKLFRNTLEGPRSLYFALTKYNEVMELVFAMGLAFFMIYQIRRIKIGREDPSKIAQSL